MGTCSSKGASPAAAPLNPNAACKSKQSSPSPNSSSAASSVAPTAGINASPTASMGESLTASDDESVAASNDGSQAHAPANKDVDNTDRAGTVDLTGGGEDKEEFRENLEYQFLWRRMTERATTTEVSLPEEENEAPESDWWPDLERFSQNDNERASDRGSFVRSTGEYPFTNNSEFALNEGTQSQAALENELDAERGNSCENSNDNIVATSLESVDTVGGTNTNTAQNGGEDLVEPVGPCTVQESSCGIAPTSLEPAAAAATSVDYTTSTASGREDMVDSARPSAVQESSSDHLHFREIVDECMQRGADPEAIDVAVTALIHDNATSMSLDVASFCLTTLWLLARKNDENKQQMLCDPKVITVIIETMQIYRERSAGVLTRACGLLWTLSVVDDNSTRQVSQCGGCEAVLNSIMSHMEDEALQGIALMTLKVLSCDTIGASTLCTWGASSIVAEIMQKHKSNKTIQSQGCAVVRNLAA